MEKFQPHVPGRLISAYYTDKVVVIRPDGKQYVVKEHFSEKWDDLKDALLYKVIPCKYIAKGHNPRCLTVDQVGEGWRLLDKDEIKERPYYLLSIEQYGRGQENVNDWYVNNPTKGNLLTETYRTKLTREELKKIDNKSASRSDKRYKLAEFIGYKNINIVCWRGHLNGCESTIPNWFESLDACNDLERRLADEQWDTYVAHLISPAFYARDGITRDTAKRLVHAAASRRAEALGEALNLW